MQEVYGKITTIKRVGVLISKDDYGAFYDNSGDLLLKYADKKDCLRQHAQKSAEMKKAGKWASSHPLHSIRHEIGHAIQLEHKINDQLWEDKVKLIQDIMSSLPEYDRIGFVGEYSVSKYAMIRPDEFISECIAESMTKKASAVSKQVSRIVRGVD